MNTLHNSRFLIKLLINLKNKNSFEVAVRAPVSPVLVLLFLCWPRLCGLCSSRQGQNTHHGLKGTVPRDFRLRGFLKNQFPGAPEYPIRVVSNFFENSRKYSQLKMHRRCLNGKNLQSEKFFLFCLDTFG